MSIKKIRPCLLSISFIFFSSLLFSQSRISSPYSFYGLGNLSDIQSARFLSLGGLSYAVSSPYSVNLMNPASYSAYDSLSFLFEGGISMNSVKLVTLENNQTSNYASLGYLLFGFPVTKWWRASFGITPYSQTGYSISETRIIDSIGKVKYTYEGNGGINRVFLGSAFRIYKGLSLGFNASFLFGPMSKTRTTTFPDSIYMTNSRIDNTTRINAFTFDFGLQYHLKLKKDISIGIGLVYGLQTNLSAKRNMFVETFTRSSSGIEYVQDTIENSPDVKGKIYLPAKIGGGLCLSKLNHWLIGVDANWQNWSKFTNFGEKDSMRNSLRFSAGAEYIPDYNSNSYLKRVSYRVGYHHTDSYLVLKGYKVNEFGISVGFGFPLRKSRSSINLTIEYGQKGTTDGQLIKENFTKFTIGFSAFERWFIKSKIE
jgi:hypothetical protein